MKSEWEEIEETTGELYTRRMRIPEGWLYRHGNTAMVFVPEPKTSLQIEHLVRALRGLLPMASQLALKFPRNAVYRESIKDAEGALNMVRLPLD